MEEKYLMVSSTEADDFMELKRNEGFKVQKGHSYTDGTTKVYLSDNQKETLEEIPKPESPEEWESNRQRYLREGSTNGAMALEGASLGYLPLYEEEGYNEIICWGDAAQEERSSNYFLEEIVEVKRNSLGEKRRRTIRKKQSDGSWQEEKIRRWQNEWEYPEITQDSSKVIKMWQDENELLEYRGNFLSEYRGNFLSVNAWKIPLQRKVSNLIRKMSEEGLFFQTGPMSEEDKHDYVGHGFGLFNTGCYHFNRDLEKWEIKEKRAMDYIEEHFSRRLMSADVALELMRKTRAIPIKRFYKGYSLDKKEELVEVTLEKYRSRAREIKRQEQEKLKLSFPNFFDIFGNCEISFQQCEL